MNNKSAREILSENLTTLMNNKNVDQKMLAEAIGVSQPTISNWLNCSKYPRISKVEQMSDYFNVPKSRITENQNQDTVAAHFNKEDLTEDEIKEVEQFIEFVKNRRK